ncbi:MAG TPA: beta-L-arabinofuranosidase domain-containing protein [Bacteroidota bacterium]|nr:beta-L-arabinofuranosidase domain-containing protein [Bacteroidota bacterium]
MKLFLRTILCLGAALWSTLQAQEKLYPETFPLQDVQLLNGPFKHARDLNIHVLLQYDVDRLLAPYRKEAGLHTKAKGYPNWEGLDGHVAGHYLSALAMTVAATHHPECKQRMEYMLAELKICQDSNAITYPDWGVGYAGGMPNSKAIWSKLKTGDFSTYFSSWAPWYNLHKMFAGLRDAWMYGGSDEARRMFLAYCDWAIALTSGLSDEQMQMMLNAEHGGMDEMFADAFQMTKDEKYLRAARRFSHRALLDPMAAGNDNLDNKHANTQIPKVTGFQRIAELSNDATYAHAASFFWETVTQHRTLAFGGNSRKEHFPSVNACSDYVEDVEGPESCNSYNMMKLTEDLFRVTPSAKYIDYYERTLYNHILSTQHPVHGGYVYFTPARPRHYRVYSAPNQAMWCCVGSGMENHAKYNQLIYTHRNDSLYVNLFIASELNWKSRGITLRQSTEFPQRDYSTITITKGALQFALLVRYPSWVREGALRVTVNGAPIGINTRPSSYLAINRLWKKGDVVRLYLPMHNSIEHLPNVPAYIAFMHGPILLAAKTGTEELTGLVADDGRWGHIAAGKKLPIDKAPIIIQNDLSTIADKLEPVAQSPLTFLAPRSMMINASARMKLEPFYQIHDARYMMYWMALTNAGYKTYLDSLGAVEQSKLALDERTVDRVSPGEQQPEVDHAMQTSKSHSGNSMDEFWRDAQSGGFFSYALATKGETDLTLRVRYWGYEWGDRTFDIQIDTATLVSEKNTGRWYQSKFQNVEYPIPASMLEGKDHIRLKFQAHDGSTAGAVYDIRLLRSKKK